MKFQQVKKIKHFVLTYNNIFCIIRIMNKFINHSKIISLWPTVGEFANDIGEKETTCRGWKLRDSIPSKYWQKIIDAAKPRDFEEKITITILMAQSI